MSNWKTIVVGTRQDGSMTVLKGPDTSPEAQRKYIIAFLEGKDLPKNVAKIEMIVRSQGVVKTAALEAGETPEDRVTRAVRGLTHEVILAELSKPTKKVAANKALAEEALIAQRLAAPQAKPEPVADPGEPATEDKEPPGMGDVVAD